MRRHRAEVWNQGRLEVVDDLCAADNAHHFRPPSMVGNRDSLERVIAEIRPCWSSPLNCSLPRGDVVAERGQPNDEPPRFKGSTSPSSPGPISTVSSRERSSRNGGIGITSPLSCRSPNHAHRHHHPELSWAGRLDVELGHAPTGSTPASPWERH